MKKYSAFILSILLTWTSLVFGQSQIPGNTVKLGSKTAVNKDLIFDINQTTANPRLRANASTLKLQYTNDGTNFSDIGSGSGGGGGKNYITTGNAETGNTSGFALYDDGAATRPVNGTGGTATGVTFTNTTTNPLMDTASFVLAKDAANRQGKGVSYDFTIDAAQKAKVLTIKTKYRVDSGTFVPGTTGSSPTDGDLIVYLYDVTNSALIEPSSIKFLSSSTTLSDEFSAAFQTPSNSTSYRLIYHIASTSAVAWNLKIDDIEISPSKYIYGTPITDWTAWTATGSWVANTNYTNSYWRRVGSDMEIKGLVSVVGAPTSASLSINIPPGFSIVAPITTERYGQAYIEDLSTTGYAGTTGYGSATAIVVYAINTASSYGNPASVTQAVPFTFGTGDFVSYNAKFQIQGWSSSVQTSDQTDTRLVSFQSHINNGTRSAANNTDTIMPYNTVDSDTHGGFNTTSNAYIIPVPGSYVFYAFIETGSLFGSASDVSFNLYVNGVQRGLISRNSAAILGGFTNGSIKVDGLKTGESITVVCNQNSGGSVTIGSASNRGNFIFGGSRLSGPQAIAASESVYARYTSTAGGTIGVGGNQQTYATKVLDSHGAWNGSAFTCPISGVYEVTATIFTASVNISTAQAIDLHLYKNGNPYSRLARPTGNGVGTQYKITGTDLVQCNAGENFYILASSSVATAQDTAAGFNFINIKRVGN